MSAVPGGDPDGERAGTTGVGSQAAGLTEIQARGDIGISAVVDVRKQHIELPTGLGQRCLALDDIQHQHRLAPR